MIDMTIRENAPTVLMTPQTWGTPVYYDCRPGINAIAFYGSPGNHEAVLSHGQLENEIYVATPSRASWRSAVCMARDRRFMRPARWHRPAKPEDVPTILKNQSAMLRLRDYILKTGVMASARRLRASVSLIREREAMWKLDYMIRFGISSGKGYFSPGDYGMRQEVLLPYLEHLPVIGDVRLIQDDQFMAILDSTGVLFLGLYRYAS